MGLVELGCLPAMFDWLTLVWRWGLFHHTAANQIRSNRSRPLYRNPIQLTTLFRPKHSLQSTPAIVSQFAISTYI